MGSEKRVLKISEKDQQDPSYIPGPGNYDQSQNKNVVTYTFGAK